MTQQHQSRQSPHPLIDRVWQTENIEDGTYIATPDCSWDLLVLGFKDGTKAVMLAGQATVPVQVPYEAGTRSVVISLNASAYLKGMDGDSLLDATVMLLGNGTDTFELLGHIFRIPEYENAEELVQAMVQVGILQQDDVVASVLNGEPQAMSSRTMQRHFHEATGISRKGLEKIRRAQEAVRMLQAGTSTVTVAVDKGYTDQAHLTKELKKIMGTGTSTTDHIHKL